MMLFSQLYHQRMLKNLRTAFLISMEPEHQSTAVFRQNQGHPISNKCCTYSKDKPMEKWGRENGRKAIMGVRGTESRTRKAQYTSCLTATAKFTPLWDWTDAMMELCYKVYDIETPPCYQYLSRTGCAGCPYGRNTEMELAMLPRVQQKSVINYFRESYDVLGVEHRVIQTLMGYEETE